MNATTEILRQEITKLAVEHDLFHKPAVLKTINKYYSDICGLRRTYHLMMSAIYGSRPNNPYWLDIMPAVNVNKKS